MNGNRDKNILSHIVKYCEQIEETVALFGADYHIFCTNNIFRNACCMCLLQIGELSNSLSDDFRDSHTVIPWKQIRGFRNIIAHAYGTIEPSVVWEIITTELLALKEYCQKCMAEER